MRTYWRADSLADEEEALCFVLLRAHEDAFWSAVVDAGAEISQAKSSVGGRKFGRIRNTDDDSSNLHRTGRCVRIAFVGRHHRGLHCRYMVTQQGTGLPECINVVRAHLHAVVAQYGLTVHGFAAIRNHEVDSDGRIVPSINLQDQELHCDEKRFSVSSRLGRRAPGWSPWTVASSSST